MTHDQPCEVVDQLIAAVASKSKIFLIFIFGQLDHEAQKKMYFNFLSSACWDRDLGLRRSLMAAVVSVSGPRLTPGRTREERRPGGRAATAGGPGSARPGRALGAAAGASGARRRAGVLLRCGCHESDDQDPSHGQSDLCPADAAAGAGVGARGPPASAPALSRA